jgi:hypothetical protein
LSNLNPVATLGVEIMSVKVSELKEVTSNILGVIPLVAGAVEYTSNEDALMEALELVELVPITFKNAPPTEFVYEFVTFTFVHTRVVMLKRDVVNPLCRPFICTLVIFKRSVLKLADEITVSRER